MKHKVIIKTEGDNASGKSYLLEKIEEIFSYFRNGPIQTVSEFVYLIHEIFGAGHYMCIARAVNGAHFYLFLKFVCDDKSIR